MAENEDVIEAEVMPNATKKKDTAYSYIIIDDDANNVA